MQHIQHETFENSRVMLTTWNILKRHAQSIKSDRHITVFDAYLQTVGFTTELYVINVRNY
jgi:hypothetical protein